MGMSLALHCIYCAKLPRLVAFHPYPCSCPWTNIFHGFLVSWPRAVWVQNRKPLCKLNMSPKVCSWFETLMICLGRRERWGMWVVGEENGNHLKKKKWEQKRGNFENFHSLPHFHFSQTYDILHCLISLWCFLLVFCLFICLGVWYVVISLSKAT